MSDSTKLLLEQISLLNERIGELEERMEVSELYYQASQMRKKTAEECLEAACVNHFEVQLKHFRDISLVNKDYRKGGKPKDDYQRNIIHAQHWFLSFLVNVLHRPTYSMKNIKFYHQMKVKEHKPVFLSSTNPKPQTDEEQKNRLIYVSIRKETLRIMREENVEDEAFD